MNEEVKEGPSLESVLAPTDDSVATKALPVPDVHIAASPEAVDEVVAAMPEPSIEDQIITVNSPEELSAMVLNHLQGIRGNSVEEADKTIEFLAGVISSMQLQNMSLLAYLEYIQGWCVAATPLLQKFRGNFGAPWSFAVWERVNQCRTPEEAREFLETVKQERRANERRIITP
jgi:hypothetical protein